MRPHRSEGKRWNPRIHSRCRILAALWSCIVHILPTKGGASKQVEQWLPQSLSCGDFAVRRSDPVELTVKRRFSGTNRQAQKDKFQVDRHSGGMSEESVDMSISCGCQICARSCEGDLSLLSLAAVITGPFGGRPASPNRRGRTNPCQAERRLILINESCVPSRRTIGE